MSVPTSYFAALLTKVILDNGSVQPRRKRLNFIGVSFTDHPDTDTLDLTVSGASGEANTNSNAGAGAGQLVKAKVGVDTPIKTLAKASGDLINIANGSNEVTLSIPNIQLGTGNPNGVESGSVGDLFLQTDSSGALWQNTDGGTTWASRGGSATFPSLTDTPANYSGAALSLLRVNAAGNAVEFVADSTIHDDAAGEFASVAEKASPVGADLVLIEDSAESNSKKRVQITNLLGAVSGTFLGLTDVDDASYAGKGGYLVKVNSTPDGLELVADTTYRSNVSDQFDASTEKHYISTQDHVLIEDGEDGHSKAYVDAREFGRVAAGDIVAAVNQIPTAMFVADLWHAFATGEGNVALVCGREDGWDTTGAPTANEDNWIGHLPAVQLNTGETDALFTEDSDVTSVHNDVDYVFSLTVAVHIDPDSTGERTLWTIYNTSTVPNSSKRLFINSSNEIVYQSRDSAGVLRDDLNGGAFPLGREVIVGFGHSGSQITVTLKTRTGETTPMPGSGASSAGTFSGIDRVSIGGQFNGSNNMGGWLRAFALFNDQVSHSSYWQRVLARAFTRFAPLHGVIKRTIEHNHSGLNIAAHGQSSIVKTFLGARVGDSVAISHDEADEDLDGVMAWGEVTDKDELTIHLINTDDIVSPSAHTKKYHCAVIR